MSVCGTGVHFASKYRSSTNQGIDLYLNFQSLPTPLSWTSLSRHLPRQMCSQGFIIISKLPHCPHPCAEETVKDNSWMCLFSSLPSFWQFSTEVIWMGLWKYIYGLLFISYSGDTVWFLSTRYKLEPHWRNYFHQIDLWARQWGCSWLVVDEGIVCCGRCHPG